MPVNLRLLWTDLSGLLVAFGEIQDRLDPPRLIEYADRITPLRLALENSVAQAKQIAANTTESNSAQILIQAATQALQGATRFEEARVGPHEIMKAFQALRPIARSQEILYDLANHFEEVCKHFLHPTRTNDTDLLTALGASTLGDVHSDTKAELGVINMENQRGKRGGYTIYVPEYYTPARAWPLIIALHGGSGHGADFFWSWLRDARSFGFIVAAPTSLGRTWSLHTPAVDAMRLNGMLTHISETWNIDTKRLLLTGISDGGTYAMLLSIVHQSPFTHFAPVAAAVHVLMNRSGVIEAPVRDLRIYQVHGVRDWMFPVASARAAAAALEKAGARNVYREVSDLSHNYPRDENEKILRWFSPEAFQK
ncbi:MAG: phospholipase [Spirochaetia bacterium]|nr:phospholipase [Spirochaetia bacterium]